MPSLNEELSDQDFIGYGLAERGIKAQTHTITEHLIERASNTDPDQLVVRPLKSRPRIAGFLVQEVGLATSTGYNLGDLLPEGVGFYTSRNFKGSDAFGAVFNHETGQFDGVFLNADYLERGTLARNFTEAALAHEIGHTHLANLEREVRSDTDITRGEKLTEQLFAKLKLHENGGQLELAPDSVAEMVHAMNAKLLLETEAWNHGAIAATAMGLDNSEYESYEHNALTTYWYSRSRRVLTAWEHCKADERPETFSIYNPFLQDMEELSFQQLKDELVRRGASDANNAAIAVNTIAPNTYKRKVS